MLELNIEVVLCISEFVSEGSVPSTHRTKAKVK